MNPPASEDSSSNPLAVEVFGKKSLYFGRDITGFLVEDLVKNAVPAARVIVIVTDIHIEKLHLNDLLKAFEPFGTVKEHHAPDKKTRSTDGTKVILSYIILPGESTKCRRMKEDIEDFLLEQGCNRDTCIVAFGGGVIGDLVGFVASTYLRGIPLVQIPTTLLAMADSSIGGKNGIDTPAGKNLLGTTYEPVRTYVDLKYLITLPHRELSNGLAEVIKTCAVSSEAEFASVESNIEKICNLFEGDWKSSEAIKKLEETVLASIKFKASVVSEDKVDDGRRQYLNFGHTIGHALESYFAPYLLHGEAIAIGMVIEQEIASSMKLSKGSGDLKRLIDVLKKANLPTSILEGEKIVQFGGSVEPVTTNALMHKMSVDKKNVGKQICMSLLSQFGVPAGPKAIPVPDLEIVKQLQKQIKLLKSRKLKLEGPPDSPYAMNSVPPKPDCVNPPSIILIGAQINTLGKLLAESLNCRFLEDSEMYDLALEQGFIVATLMSRPEQKSWRNILLNNWMQMGDIVIHVVDNLNDTKSDFSDLESVSNYTYFFDGNIESEEDVKSGVETLLHLVAYASGKLYENKLPTFEFSSFFLTLLVDDVEPILVNLQSMISGTSAVELRIDLVIAQNKSETIGDFFRLLAQQISKVRKVIGTHPIIFTIRSLTQGGFVAVFESSEELLNIFHYAVRLGCEFIDLEIDLDESVIKELTIAAAKKSRIIASFHNIEKPWDWMGEDCEAYAETGAEFGDIIKLVSVAESGKDNQNVEAFIENHYATNDIPLIAFNMGQLGRESRVNNRFMTPVTHHDLRLTSNDQKLAQLTCTEIIEALVQKESIVPKEFFIFGENINYSLSPLIHNANFDYFKLPFTFGIKDSADLEEIRKTIRSPTFGGGSVTIPHKEKIIPFLDTVSDVVNKIGAVNTIVVKADRKLHGENTDWLGIQHCLGRAMNLSASKRSGSSALLIGAGGTARAALYALNTFGFKKIYVYNRTESRIEELAKCYSELDGRTVLKIYKGNKDSLSNPESPLVVIVDTTPANSGMCTNHFVNDVLSQERHASVLVKLAYGNLVPEEEALNPWIRVVTGEDILIEQGIWAGMLWTGLKPDVEHIKKIVRQQENRTGNSKKTPKGQSKLKPTNK